MISEDCLLGAPPTQAILRALLHPGGSLAVTREATGGRRGRFQARTDALSAPDDPTNNLGKLKK